jgi:uncharacterized protein (TIGR03435 family)
VRRLLTAGVLLLATIVVATPRLHGQAAQTDQKAPAFEVASIKENTSITDGGGGRLMPGGGIAMKHLPARQYVTLAFQLEQYQLVGTPAWMATTYYDVQAKVASTATRDETFRMLQALLRDRFQLRFHRESRELDGYSLVMIRAGELGPNLHRSSVDCEKTFATTPRCREGFITGGTFKTVGAPIYTLVNVIVGQTRAPVLDQTELGGTFDLDLHWSPELAATDDATSIFTALREQLGLKLERTRVPTEMLVIDHVEKPTPD